MDGVRLQVYLSMRYLVPLDPAKAQASLRFIIE